MTGNWNHVAEDADTMSIMWRKWRCDDVKTICGVIVLVGAIVGTVDVLLMKHNGMTKTEDEQRAEDEEQLRYLKEWRERRK